jgi:Uma2 family endonuclease
MIAKLRPAEESQYLLLHDISWQGYEQMLHELEGRHFRLTYDEGMLEIMTTSYEHESFSELLAYLLRILTLELAIAMCSGGSMTFKNKSLKKGLEPDKCWWIKNEQKMRNKKSFDVERDPPPDLAIEIEFSCSALDRMGIYAALKVGEVWRFDGEVLRVSILGPNGKYRQKEQSLVFPFLPIAKIVYFLKRSADVDETTLLTEFVQWIREEIAPKMTKAASKKTDKNGKHRGK